MRFLVDECTGPAVAQWLRERGHDVFSVFQSTPGIGDFDVLRLAVAESRILVTNDKDFGEAIFRDRQPHRGVVLLRLEDETSASKIAVLERLLATGGDAIANQFVVVTETRVRIHPHEQP